MSRLLLLGVGNNSSSEAAMALVSTGSLIRYPGLTSAGNAALSYTGEATVSAAGHYASYVFQAREDMSINYIQFRVGTCTGSPTADVRIETVGTNGIPSGTLWATSTNKVTGTLTTNSSPVVTLDATATITKGQFFAVKIAYNSGTNFIINRLAGPRATISNVPYVVTNTGSGDTKNPITTAAALGIGSSSSSFYALPNCYPSSAVTNSTFNNTNGARRGLRFQLPFACRIAGLAWYNSTSTGDFNVILMNDAGTELSSSSTSVDGDYSGASTSAIPSVIFDSPVEVSASTWYRAVVEPTSATNVNVSFLTLTDANYRSAYPMGTNAHYTTYINTPQWTDDTDKIPFMDILIDQILTYS